MPPERWIKKRELPKVSTQRPGVGRWVRPMEIKLRDTHVLHRRGWQGAAVGLDDLERRAVSHDQVRGSVHERIVYRELLKRRLPFDFQSSIEGGRLELGGMVADFILLDRPVIIRVQGAVWHTGLFPEAKDRAQKAVLQGYGYTVLDLWDWEIESAGLLENWFRENIDVNVPSLGGGVITTGMRAEDMGELEASVSLIKDRVDILEGAIFNAIGNPLVRISAQNIQVSTLSAISANLGTVTAGTYKTSATVGEVTNGQGIIINSSHIAAYDSIGDLQFEIDAATGLARTGISAPYAALSDSGLTVYSTNTSNSGLFLNNTTTSTVSDIRECMGGMAISSDQSEYCVFRVYDTAYDVGTTNLRFELLGADGANYFYMRDEDDAEIFRIETTTSTGVATFAGDLLFGEAATDKVGFWGATPIVRPAKADYNNWTAFTDVVDALVDIGLFDAA